MYSIYPPELFKAWLRDISPADVVVHVGGQQFPAHKTVLCVHSGYLKALLAPDPSLNIISVPNVTPEAFGPLLTFMYSGFLDLTSENIYQVLLSAHLLHMPRALELCRAFLVHHQQCRPPSVQQQPSTSNHYTSSEPTAMNLTSTANSAAGDRNSTTKTDDHHQRHNTGSPVDSETPTSKSSLGRETQSMLRHHLSSLHSPHILPPLVKPIPSRKLPPAVLLGMPPWLPSYHPSISGRPTSLHQPFPSLHHFLPTASAGRSPFRAVAAGNKLATSSQQPASSLLPVLSTRIPTSTAVSGSSRERPQSPLPGGSSPPTYINHPDTDCTPSSRSKSLMAAFMSSPQACETKLSAPPQTSALSLVFPSTSLPYPPPIAPIISHHSHHTLPSSLHYHNPNHSPSTSSSSSFTSEKSTHEKGHNQQIIITGSQSASSVGSSGQSSTSGRREKSRSNKENNNIDQQLKQQKVIIDIACCDGPVRFHRVLNDNYGLSIEDLLSNDRQQRSTPNKIHQKDNNVYEDVGLERGESGDSHAESAKRESTSDDAGNSKTAVEPTDDEKSQQQHTPLYRCLYCNHTFKSHYCYQKHTRRHINPVTLDLDKLANRMRKTESSLSVLPKQSPPHVTPPPVPTKLLDLNVQYYPCKTCGSKFPSYYFVHKHRKLCHGIDEPTGSQMPPSEAKSPGSPQPLT